MSELDSSQTSEPLAMAMYEVVPSGGQLLLASRIVEHFAFRDLADPAVRSRAAEGKIGGTAIARNQHFELQHDIEHPTKIVLTTDDFGREDFDFINFSQAPTEDKEKKIAWLPPERGKNKINVETSLGIYSLAEAENIMNAIPKDLDKVEDLFELKSAILHGGQELTLRRATHALHTFFLTINQKPKQRGLIHRTMNRLRG